MTIPAQAHFCWIGGTLPWAYIFAVLSAAERSALPRIVLHHTDALPDSPEMRALQTDERVTLSHIDPDRTLTEAGSLLGIGDALATLYRRVPKPVTRSDVLRAAILYLQGGIYLDLDTVTVADLTPLLDATQFVGTERIVWPEGVRRSRSPVVWARHLSLDVLRRLCRALPQGWRTFRRFESHYPRSINNAVFGAEPRSRLLERYLRAMLSVPASLLDRPYAFGPHLLQRVVADYPHADLTIQEPSVFYPLAPEISDHWFRDRAAPQPTAILSADTRLVHWYASVHTGPRVARITPDSVRDRRRCELYSMLVHGCLPRFFAAA